MMVSTRGRYALRIMIDLAEHAPSPAPEGMPKGTHDGANKGAHEGMPKDAHDGANKGAHDGWIPMKEAAKRQGISLKYMEQILPLLVKGGLLAGVQGKGGGYRLTKAPEEITVGAILRLTEGDLAPVACLEEAAPACERAADCRTRPLWQGLAHVINDYLDRCTLASLCAR